jgi:hypothetical protein
MRVIVTRNTFVAGQLVEANPEPVELSEGIARTLIGLNKAVEAPAPVVSVETAIETPPPPVVADEIESEPAPSVAPKAKEKK